MQVESDRVLKALYEPVNDGVYRAGFAKSQRAYERALGDQFEALDNWEAVLDEQRYLCGEVLTEADVCLFTTLYRFDPAFYPHLKHNRRRIVDYPNLWNYLLELAQPPDVGSALDLESVKAHYYLGHRYLNPPASSRSVRTTT